MPSVPAALAKPIRAPNNEVETTRSGLKQACSLCADVVLGDLCLGMRDGIK
jgi:hypothetical protein